MDDPVEHALVVKALTEGLGGCVEWDEKGARLVRDDRELRNITPQWIKAELISFVRRAGGDVIEQRDEKREPYCRNYRFYYMAILPYPKFLHGLFVEIRLTDDDDLDFPVVTIVRAHRELK